MASAANYFVETRRARATFNKKLLLALVCISPILYSVDTDTWREWEVALFGALTAMLGFVCGVRPKVSSDVVIILLYGVFLTFQQMLIPMTPYFGTKYGVLMAAALVPSLMLRWMDWRYVDLNRLLDVVMKAISLVLSATILASKILGIGETYEGHAGQRSFGFLGDSISPVIVFPILYFLFERKWLYAAVMCLVLLLTGGKAASVMLLVAFLIMVVLNAHWILRPTVVAVLFGLGLYVYPQIEARISPEGYEYSWNTRTISYELGWQAFERSPWYGVGINQTMKDLVSRGDELARDRGIKRYYEVFQIHNAFIRSLAETGVLGFSLLVAL